MALEFLTGCASLRNTSQNLFCHHELVFGMQVLLVAVPVSSLDLLIGWLA